jgi:hypothetical protein
MEKTWEIREKEIRENIINEIEQKMFPICICQHCDNLAEGELVKRAISIVRGHQG